ncbi:NADH-quinone oxidoreductase subunit J [Rubrivirga sp. IMCC45206]|uniref:NADH-quinone oxidoreductase subunit J n=1 Tax=Rubrivirga sp. IMCC45206 TaxID=3391614 RepID=UPI00398FC0AE
MEAFLFFVFAVFAVAGAVGMLVSRSPVASALWMVTTMLAIACLYLSLNAAFIGIVQVLVYAGAIMVLFLFVIMLLNLEQTPRLSAVTWPRAAAFVGAVGVLALLLTAVAGQVDLLPDPTATEVAVVDPAGPAVVVGPDGEAVVVEPGEAALVPLDPTSVENLGIALLTRHAFTLEIIGALLLAATIGAVLLAKKRFV